MFRGYCGTNLPIVISSTKSPVSGLFIHKHIYSQIFCHVCTQKNRHTNFFVACLVEIRMMGIVFSIKGTHRYGKWT